MATPKKKYSYTIFYNDGTYMTFELTKEDFNRIEAGLTQAQAQIPTFASVSIGIIGLSNIKAVIEQKDAEPEEEEQTQGDTLPPLDQESYNWIKEQIGGF